MLSRYVILSVILAVAYGRIQIKINADEDADLSSVSFTGQDVAIISDVEIESFHLTDRALKDASEKFAGRRCTDVYLKRPTPWADVYRKFGWDEVQRTLKPVSAKILNFRTRPVAVSTTRFKNPSQFKGKYGSILTHSVEDTLGHTWSKGGELTIAHAISYGVSIGPTTNMGASSSVAFMSSWGNETTQEKKVTLAATSSVEVELPPHKAVLATLTASKGTMEIQVEYEATVSGDVFCNHHGKYKGHMWWAYDLNALEKYGNFPKSVKSTEVITVGFYTDFTVKLTDLAQKQVQNIPAHVISIGDSYNDRQ